MTRTRLGLAAGIALLGGTLTVHAQNVGQGGRLVGGGFAPVVQQHDTPSAKLPPAPALPGTANAAPAAPSDTLPTDMPPTEALFDAINRGDIEAVRDAINRGADIRGQNVLGMTPTELSVDLGRNDITFLLVTLLHAGGSQISDAQGGPMAMPPENTLGLSSKDQHAAATPVAFFGNPTGHTTAAHKKYTNGTSEVSATTRLRSVPQKPVRQPAYADSTGAPVPSAGFVGFGSSAQ